MSTEDTGVGERRRRRIAGQTLTGETGGFAPVTDEPVGLTRREMRELREQQERSAAAAEATQASLEAVPPAPPARVSRTQASAPAVGTPAEPVGPEHADESLVAGPPNRRSMRDVRPETPAGPPGRGERVPAKPAVTPPAKPVVRTPAAAQGIRSVDETGTLSGVRSTRATADAPVEVTGPLDWSSAVLPAVVKPVEKVAEIAAEAPARRSVLRRDDVADVEEVAAPAVVPAAVKGASARPAWESVTGDGSGATVPRPEVAPPPDPEGVFGAEALAAAAAEPVAAEAEESESTQDDDARPSRWMSPLGFVLLALLGVAVGAGIFFLLLR